MELCLRGQLRLLVQEHRQEHRQGHLSTRDLRRVQEQVQQQQRLRRQVAVQGQQQVEVLRVQQRSMEEQADLQVQDRQAVFTEEAQPTQEAAVATQAARTSTEEARSSTQEAQLSTQEVAQQQAHLPPLRPGPSPQVWPSSPPTKPS